MPFRSGLIPLTRLILNQNKIKKKVNKELVNHMGIVGQINMIEVEIIKNKNGKYDKRRVKYKVINGHQRIMALKILKIKNALCIWWED